MPDKISDQINVNLTLSVTEISKYMLNLNIYGMIYDIASFLITRSSDSSTYKVLHFTYSSYFGKQYNTVTMLSVLAHSVTKSLFHNPFQVPSAIFYHNS